MKKHKSILIGILSGFIVLFSGFVVMYLLWIKIGSPEGLPGFFHYRAATLGDGICLPILVASLVMFNQQNSTYYLHKRNICVIMAIVASTIAIGLQASWLIRDDTILNWSIPIQHHFNVAGWYHSLFFIAIFGIVTYQLCCMWFILRERKTEYLWFEKCVFLLFVFAGTLFLLLHMNDDYGQYLKTPILLSSVVVGVLLLLVVYIKTANRKGSMELFPALVMGIISAYSISIFLYISGKGDPIIALGGGLCVCFIWRVHNLLPIQMVLKDIWSIIIYFIILYKVSALSNIGELVCVLLFLTFVTVKCEEKSNNEAKYRAVSLIVIEGYLLINSFPIEIKEIDTFVNILFIAAVSLLFKKEIKNYFSEVINAEVELNKNYISRDEFKTIKGKAYLQIVIGILAAVLLIFHWLFGMARENETVIGMGIWYSSETLIAMFAVILSLLFLFGIGRVRKYTTVKILTLFLTVFLFMNLINSVVLNIGLGSFSSWTMLEVIILCCSGCACIGTGILCAHGFYMNMVCLRGLHRKKLVATIALIQGMGGMLVVFFVTVLILCNYTWKSLFFVAMATVATFVVIPLLHARIFQSEQKRFHVVGNNYMGGIAQDGLMICLIVFFVICMPCLYIKLNVRGLNACLNAIALACTAFPPVSYCLRNNVEHIKRQRKVLVEYPKEEEMWNTLRRCLVRQSKQTIFATFPYVCIALAASYGSRMMSNMERRKIFKDIYCTYIDAEDYESEENSMDEDKD